MNHDLDYKELQRFLTDTKVLFARTGTPADGKEMLISLNGNIEIIHNGVLVWTGMQPFRAVEEYNEIR